MRLALVLALFGCAGGTRLDPIVIGGERVVVVSVDGLMPAAYLDPDAHGLAIPTLRALVARGAAGRVRSVMPTSTYPAHTTLVTGVPPALHGIVSNRPLDPLDKNLDGWRWYAEDIAVPTLYQAVEAQHRVAALVVWPVSVGARASVVVPEYWRAGGGDDQKLLRALSTAGVLEDVARADPDLWTALTPPAIADRAQFAIARHVLATRHPDLLLVHVFQLDDAQHAHGPWSPEAKAVIEADDRELGALLAQLDDRTTLLVVSDHGFAPIDHEIHLGALFAKHGLVDATHADVAVLAEGGTALIHVLTPARRAAVDAAIRELGDAVARVIEHDELVKLGADPQATFALVAAPGHAFSAARTGDIIVETGPRGSHGWPPDDAAMEASFIAVGHHIPHTQLGRLEMIDIGPTIARWLGVPLPTATGKPIAALVR